MQQTRHKKTTHCASLCPISHRCDRCRWKTSQSHPLFDIYGELYLYFIFVLMLVVSFYYVILHTLKSVEIWSLIRQYQTSIKQVFKHVQTGVETQSCSGVSVISGIFHYCNCHFISFYSSFQYHQIKAKVLSSNQCYSEPQFVEKKGSCNFFILDVIISLFILFLQQNRNALKQPVTGADCLVQYLVVRSGSLN